MSLLHNAEFGRKDRFANGSNVWGLRVKTVRGSRLKLSAGNCGEWLPPSPIKLRRQSNTLPPLQPEGYYPYQ
jgi:hypothetical protein